MKLSAILKEVVATLGDIDVANEFLAGQISRRASTLIEKLISDNLKTQVPPGNAPLDLPPLHILKRRYDYDPVSGIVFLIKKSQERRPAGERHATGYVRLNIHEGGKRYRCAAHRVAWYMHYGVPAPNDMVIDHIDGNRSNNAIHNLRTVTQKENMRSSIAMWGGGIKRRKARS